MSNCYKILDIATIERQYLKPNKMTIDDYDYQLQTNYAFVYRLPDSTMLLLPGGWRAEEEGFVLDNEDCLKEMIEKDNYPINDSEDVHSKKRYEMLQLPSMIDEYQSRLNEALNLSYTTINRETLGKYYAQIQGFQLRGLSKEEGVFYLSILVGEYLRTEVDGKWMLSKYYNNFNPYYVAEVLNKDNKVYRYQIAFEKYMYSDFPSLDFFFKIQKPSLHLDKIPKHLIDKNMIIFD